MSDLTDKFTTLEGQLATQHTAVIGGLDDILNRLDAVNVGIDLLINNNATNTKLLLNAIAASAACSPCPVPPIAGTPPVTTPGSINANWCRRVQAFLAVIDLFATYADSLGELANAFTPGFVTGIIEEIRTTTGDSGIPVPGWIDTLTIASAGVNFIVNRALLGGSLHASFDPIRDDLQAALFASGNASEAKSAYDAGIDLAPGLAASQPLLKQLGFSDLMNHFFDPASSPVVDGYNGTVCGAFACYTFTNADCIVVDTEDGEKVIPDWTIYGLVIESNPGHDNAIWTPGNWRGWEWTITNNGADVYHVAGGNSPEDGFQLTGTFGNLLQIPSHLTFVSSAPFSLEFCAPAS